ncbi:uncharacterized protein LOC130761694 [Actinidia eriantha]|uniref:uncharacterized protein LOC130761694 n=1 Tax=Actinidia eriantha TaxID=165200 RepID=UPI00258FA177|nr:uncharacterized protein LOC130761694 [Actinidia eriantha]
MSYGAGPSYQVSDSSSSSSSDESYHEDPTPEFDMQTQDTEFQWNHMMLQQQMIVQQYYLMQSQNASLWGGSLPGHVVIQRGRQTGATLLKNDYFGENPTYESKFRRRFRMSRELFLRIRRSLKEHLSLWKTSYDAARRPADSFEQYFRIGESTLLDYVKHFCRDIVTVFGPTYLRKPNADDIERLLQVAKHRGFPGMLGSLDCMHWEWKNCPTANAGAYRGQNKGCTMILEAVASYDTWIWHAFFGLLGTNNDVNVLHKFNLFQDLTNGTSLPANYSIKGKNYKVGYYLADGIYPKWSTLVQTIRVPTCEKERYFVKKQESYRKDVERAFGVLQARFAIVRGAARL